MKKISRPSRQHLSPKTISQWKAVRELGDIEKIKQATGLSVVTISNAFKGVATAATVTAIDKYYAKQSVA